MRRLWKESKSEKESEEREYGKWKEKHRKEGGKTLSE